MLTHFHFLFNYLDFENNCIHTMMKTWTFHTSVWRKYLTLRENVIWLHNLCYALLLLQLEIDEYVIRKKLFQELISGKEMKRVAYWCYIELNWNFVNGYSGKVHSIQHQMV